MLRVRNNRRIVNYTHINGWETKVYVYKELDYY